MEIVIADDLDNLFPAVIYIFPFRISLPKAAYKQYKHVKWTTMNIIKHK